MENLINYSAFNNQPRLANYKYAVYGQIKAVLGI